MQVKWGSYSFTSNSCFVGVRQVAIKNKADTPYLYATDIDVSGRLYGNSQSELAASETALRAALHVPFQDFKWLRDDGGNTSVVILNRNTIGGITCTRGPDFVSKYGAEYAVIREFSFTLSTNLPVLNLATALVAFEESVDYDGGGPEYLFKRALNGPPQKQLGWFQTEYTAVQRGSAVGFLAYPPYPAPSSPADMRVSPKYRKQSPRRIGNSYIEFPITWEFQMASTVPLIAAPRIWT